MQQATSTSAPADAAIIAAYADIVAPFLQAFGVPTGPTVRGLLDRAMLLVGTGRSARAEIVLWQAVRLDPDDLRPPLFLAWLHAERGEMPTARRLAEGVCRRHPGRPEPLIQLANLAWWTDPDEAERLARAVLALDPRQAGAETMLGSVALRRGDAVAAIDGFRRALTVDPGLTTARTWLATTLLQVGRLAEGVAELARVLRPDGPIGLAPGASLDGRTVVLLDTHGIGDAVLWARYIPALARNCGRVVLVTPAERVRLFERLPGLALVLAHRRPQDVADGTLELHDAVGDRVDRVPSHEWLRRQGAGLDLAESVTTDLWALPHILGVDGPEAHVTHPYLAAVPEDVARWRAWLPADRRLNIGLVWGTSEPWPPYPISRSLPLAALAPLGHPPGVRLYSLQQGPPRAALRDRPPGLEVVDLAGDGPDLAATAAAIAALDLVIGPDTGVTNLAAALGARTWVLSRGGAMRDWRWGASGPSSPWYPAARVFSQRRPCDWSGPVADVAAELERLVAGRAAA